MFFPAESDALSPLAEYVKPYKPPAVPVKMRSFYDLMSPAVTGMAIDTGWVPTMVDLELVHR